MRTIICSFLTMSPAVVAALSGLLQPHGQPAHITRWRLLRTRGAGRVRSALGLVS